MNNSRMTTFYIVRHGETDWNLKRMIQGHNDIPLNETGEKQAKVVSKELQYIKFDLAFSSDLLRAKKTAEIIALEHKLVVQSTHLLRERYFADFEGKPAEALHTYDKLVEKLSQEERFRHKAVADAESDEEIVLRVIPFLRETAITNPEKNVLIATHGGVIRSLLIHLGVFSYRDIAELRITNGAYIKLLSDGVDFFIAETHGIEKNKELIKEV